MVNFIISYDDNDSELADYFEANQQYISGIMAGMLDVSTHLIAGIELSQRRLSEKVNEFDNAPFLFAGYSHGNSQELLTDNEVYVCSENCELFKNSVFYTTACETAVSLGNQLIENGCTSFIGYADYSLAPTNENYNDLFIECENHALRIFMTEDVTLGDAFDLMLHRFDDEMMAMLDADEVIAAMELSHNRDRFDIQGDENITFSTIQDACKTIDSKRGPAIINIEAGG